MTVAADLAVDLAGVTKTYGTGDSKVTALRGVDLEVAPDELLMLVGPSGCGKTTLISIVAGILDQDGGSCHVFGQDLQAMSDGARVRFRGDNIGFVFQAFNLLPTLTAAENVAIPLLIKGVPRREAVRKGEAMLEKVGLIGPREVAALAALRRPAAARRDRPLARPQSEAHRLRRAHQRAGPPDGP